MRVTMIGSRSLSVDIAEYVPEGMTQLLSGGGWGVNAQAEAYADANGIPKLIFRSDKKRMISHTERMERVRALVEVADQVIASWDGSSPCTRDAIEYCKKIGRPVQVYVLPICQEHPQACRACS